MRGMAAGGVSCLMFRSTARTGKTVSGKPAPGAATITAGAENPSQRLTRGLRPYSCANSQQMRSGARLAARDARRAQFAAAPQAQSPAAPKAKRGAWGGQSGGKKPQKTAPRGQKRGRFGAPAPPAQP